MVTEEPFNFGFPGLYRSVWAVVVSREQQYAVATVVKVGLLGHLPMFVQTHLVILEEVAHFAPEF